MTDLGQDRFTDENAGWPVFKNSCGPFMGRIPFGQPGDKWPAIHDGLTHFPKSSMWRGLVESPVNSGITAVQISEYRD
jgi:hypothetical protein